MLRGMGTTLTALALSQGGPAVCAHIGDSRLYRFREGRLVQLTRDHNVGTELVERGVVPADDLIRHPQRHMLTRALGAEAEAVPDVFPVTYLAGDAFLLVTDGLVEALGEAGMVRTLQEADGWQDVGPRLIAACQRTAASDDATVVAVRVHTAAPGTETGEGAPR